MATVSVMLWLPMPKKKINEHQRDNQIAVETPQQVVGIVSTIESHIAMVAHNGIVIPTPKTFNGIRSGYKFTFNLISVFLWDSGHAPHPRIVYNRPDFQFF